MVCSSLVISKQLCVARCVAANGRSMVPPLSRDAVRRSQECNKARQKAAAGAVGPEVNLVGGIQTLIYNRNSTVSGVLGVSHTSVQC